MGNEIIVRGARLHNLQNIDVRIPKEKLVVLTGVSGSGKSTLALDILHQEGSRQYMESLGLVTDGMTRPPVDFISGLSPSISIDQHLTNRSPRSTVGTATEVFTYLRVLYARLGHRPCPDCGADVPPPTQGEPAWNEDDEPAEDEWQACPNCGRRLPGLGMASFSFNKPAGACPRCTGLGVIGDLVVERVFDFNRGAGQGGVLVWDAFNTERLAVTLQRAAEHYGFHFDPGRPIGELDEAQRELLFFGVDSPEMIRRFPGIRPPSTVRKGHFEGVLTNLRRRYAEGGNEAWSGVKFETLFHRQACPDCGGTRLKEESRAVHVAGKTIVDLSRGSLHDVAVWVETLPGALSPDENKIAGPILADLRERIRRLISIGVGYLSLERATPSLSAGESQRLRLAALLGSGLTGVLYVLDEPTIGLHQRDTARLIAFLKQLRDLGNTVLVIEHDLELIRCADLVIEIGPGAGRLGGRIVAEGSAETISLRADSPTGAYLNGRESLPPRPLQQAAAGELVIRGAREHNLKNVTVSIPLGRLCAVTGVSGSGKSTLIFDILDKAARRRFHHSAELPGAHDEIQGWEHLDRVVTVDQTPIGRIPRSNAATYTEVFSAIREVFSALPQARARKLSPGFFSFNTPGGRCERCEGAGTLTVNMHFLPDVQVRCPSCKGRRYRKEALAVHYHGANISQVLDMTIREALELFASEPTIRPRLQLLEEVGLGYLQLGQPATTLSGGEAQRVKLAKELSRRGGGRTLYLLDEPTTGLHMADVARLLHLLRRLVSSGNSVVVVEHHLELVRVADWVIDLGLEGGEAGGEVLAAGTPEEIMAIEHSYTGRGLRAL